MIVMPIGTQEANPTRIPICKIAQSSGMYALSFTNNDSRSERGQLVPVSCSHGESGGKQVACWQVTTARSLFA
jgi:hypothetical protein